MNKDELKGKAKDLKGRATEGAGEMVDDERLEHEGKAEQLEGQTQDAFGRGKRRAGQAIEDAGEGIKE